MPTSRVSLTEKVASVGPVLVLGIPAALLGCVLAILTYLFLNVLLLGSAGVSYLNKKLPKNSGHAMNGTVQALMLGTVSGQSCLT